jgi:ribosomal protein S27E
VSKRVGLAQVTIHARLSAVWCEDCGGHRNVYSLGSALIIAACTLCGATSVVKEQPRPPATMVQIIEIPLATPLAIYQPISEAGLLSKVGDDSAHDHREFESDPLPAIEYSTGGGSIGLSPFTSVPGAARPGMMSPGVV